MLRHGITYRVSCRNGHIRILHDGCRSRLFVLRRMLQSRTYARHIPSDPECLRLPDANRLLCLLESIAAFAFAKCFGSAFKNFAYGLPDIWVLHGPTLICDGWETTTFAWFSGSYDHLFRICVNDQVGVMSHDDDRLLIFSPL